MKLPRYHPLIYRLDDEARWFVCDGERISKVEHAVAEPDPDYIATRFETYNECREFCDELNAV